MGLDELDHRESGLVDRHIAFLEALRSAGLPVSLAENLDAIAALQSLHWGERSTVRDAYAATLVKRQSQRPTFDALFDLYFPGLVGSGAASAEDTGGETVRDGADALRGFRDELLAALGDGDDAELQRLAVEAVGRFGAMPGRGPGLSSWSAYTALQRIAPDDLIEKLVASLLAQGRVDEEARRVAGRRIGAFTRVVEGDARRRIAEEKGPTTSPTSPSGRRSTGSTSPPRARRTSRRCAARSTPLPAGSRPG